MKMENFLLAIFDEIWPNTLYYSTGSLSKFKFKLNFLQYFYGIYHTNEVHVIINIIHLNPITTLLLFGATLKICKKIQF